MSCNRTFVLTAAGLFLLAAITPVKPLVAGDWPCILGPDRNGVATDEKPIEPWGKDGPAVAWKLEVGEGFAGSAILDDRLIIFHRIEDKEIVQAVKLENGEEIWKESFPTDSSGSYSPDGGPLCVPAISGDRVVVFGVSGNMHCLNFSDGKIQWSRNLHKQLDAPMGYFGAGSSPLIVDGKVLVNAGGKKGGVVALNINDGETIWAKTDLKASYSSPVLFEHRGKQSTLFVTRLDTIAVDVATGDQLFTLPFGERGTTVNGASPLVKGDRMFLTASYRIGAQMVDISGEQPKVIWENDSSLSSQYSTAIWQDEFLFGSHGREDVGTSILRCVDAGDGTIKWSHDDPVPSHLIRVGNRLLVWSVDGKLRLLNLNSEKYEELANAEIFEGPSRALPALSNGKLIVRSNAVGGTAMLKCLNLSE